eukprot:Lithocolla_globosa_v1_NODE_5893_length_1169_cov_17.663375.p1 type:complete len:265 gc:universal NODE_5893_length_1169_cov_17.663375:895-101(-)
MAEWKVRILSSETVDGDPPFVTYTHEAIFGSEKWTVQSRFSRFAWLDKGVRKAYKHNHLYGSLPVFPRKRLKMMVDHYDREFVEERRMQLESYITKLARFPGISSVPEWTEFLQTNTKDNKNEFRRLSIDSRTLSINEEDGEESYIISGYLSKQGLKGPQGWKKRWFALNSSGELLYYKSEKDNKEKGIVKVDHHTAVRLTDEDFPRPYCFQLITPTRVFYISADDKPSVDRWVDEIGKFTGKHSANEKTGRGEDDMDVYDSFV